LLLPVVVVTICLIYVYRWCHVVDLPPLFTVTHVLLITFVVVVCCFLLLLLLFTLLHICCYCCYCCDCCCCVVIVVALPTLIPRCPSCLVVEFGCVVGFFVVELPHCWARFQLPVPCCWYYPLLLGATLLGAVAFVVVPLLFDCGSLLRLLRFVTLPTLHPVRLFTLFYIRLPLRYVTTVALIRCSLLVTVGCCC